MSNVTRFEPGAVIADFRLLQHAGSDKSDVWKAEDVRSGRVVALKLLNRSVPPQGSRRDALLATIRQKAALRHPAFARVLDFVVTPNDELFMITEWVEGKSLMRRVADSLPTARELLKLTYQLGEALADAHERGVVHGNLSTENIVIDAGGNVRLMGLGLSALTDRRERGDATAELDGTALGRARFDMNALAHSSPEQVTGKTIDAQSDVFGVGTIVYELATGKPAFSGVTPVEVATNVVKTNPRNPMELNPRIAPPMLQIIGRSLFKKKEARYQSLGALLDDLKKIEPTLPSLAAYPREQAKVVQSTSAVANLFVAEIPYADLLMKKDPERATRMEAKMQQILGEAVYLFDGELIDSIGPRIIATLPTPEKAIDAARKSLADLLEFNGTVDARDAVEPRILLHRGDVTRSESEISGTAHAFALQVLPSVQPMQLLVSDALLKADGTRESTPVGSIGGVAFHELKPEPPRIDESSEPLPSPTVAAAMPAAPVAEAEATAAAPRRSLTPVIAIAAIALIVLAGVFVMFRRRSQQLVKPVSRVQAPKPHEDTGRISIVAASDVAAPAPQQASVIVSALTELLTQSGAIKVVPADDRGAMHLTLRPAAPAATDTAAPTTASTAPIPAALVAQLDGRPDGPSVPVASAGDATAQLLRWLAPNMHLSNADRLLSQNGEAMDAFALAASRWNSTDAASRKSAVDPIRIALARDPQYLPANRLAFKVFSESGDRKDAIAVADRISQLDPSDLAVVKKLAVWRAEEPNAVAAIRAAALVLKQAPTDADALAIIARYALAAGDRAKFDKAVTRLESSPAATQTFVHRPDFLNMADNFDGAAKAYYDIEPNQQGNADLALKIGRIAALRDSFEIANIELQKLQKLSPNYGAPLLQAYLAARQKQAGSIEALLATARANATWHDDIATAAAEIYATLDQKNKVVASLEEAIKRGEATESMILGKQTFFYLGYDARSAAVKNTLEQRKSELAAALNEVNL